MPEDDDRMMTRPLPPAALVDSPLDMFVPAHDVTRWLTATFLDTASKLFNPDHAHLQGATLGVLWTNVANARHGKAIVGQCELGAPRGNMGKWVKAKAVAQLEAWFGAVPDFVLTFFAPYAAECSDVQWLALVEHECYHTSHVTDAFGAPKFTPEGQPVYGIKGHDAEVFIGVARRYGAVEPGVRELMDVLSRSPEVAAADVAGACGTCLRLVA
jgi:Putative phage metallopeptidase